MENCVESKVRKRVNATNPNSEFLRDDFLRNALKDILEFLRKKKLLNEYLNS